MVVISSEYPLKNWWCFFFLWLKSMSTFFSQRLLFLLCHSEHFLWAVLIFIFFWQFQNSNSRLLQNENMKIEFKRVTVMKISCNQSHCSKSTCKFVVRCFFSSRKKQKHSSFTWHLFFISFVAFSDMFESNMNKKEICSWKKMFLFLFLFKNFFLCVYV